MEPNKASQQFELNTNDRQALAGGNFANDIPATWPFSSAVELLELAQKQYAEISTRDTSHIPAGPNKTSIEQRHWNLAGHLTTIINQLRQDDFLPSVSDGAEKFLDDQSL